MAAATALREALNNGISSGTLTDTRIVLYSHRDSSGRVCRPKPLYANSHILKTLPYFNRCLFGYFEGSQSKDSNEALNNEEEIAEDYGYLSDSDLEDDEDEKVRQLDPFAIAGEDKIVREEHEERIEKDKVVKIPDIALVTFQAFLMYLYTGKIEFAPFGSAENRRSRSAEIVDPSDDKFPRPSPKSIYRLADKYNIPALKALALNQIRGELANCDIVEESFSRFSSQYDEVRSLYIKQLEVVWMEDSTTEMIRARVDKKIDRFVEGELKHATKIISALWEIANKEEDVIASSNITPVGTWIPSPARQTSMDTALIKSIRKGVFFDRKYWARHVKAGEMLKPIYFSSKIMSDKAQQLTKLVTYLEGRTPLTGVFEENAESDCDGDSPGVNGESKNTEDEKEETRAVLTIGSFSAWKSLFFYRCADTIIFAPLKSEGLGIRSFYIREHTTAAAPPPCSPKSIYVLANLLEIDSLRKAALVSIRCRVCLNNVVEEVFSWVTANQQEITELQCEQLVSSFRGPNTITGMKENIRKISDGSSPHCAGVLKLGFKKAFELKRMERQPQPEVADSYLTSGFSSVRLKKRKKKGWR